MTPANATFSAVTYGNIILHELRGSLPAFSRLGICEQDIQPLRHRRVGENGVSQLGVWESSQHGRLYDGNHLSGCGPQHLKPKMRSLRISRTTFMIPRVSPMLRARRTEAMGSVTTLMSSPF